ncbi:gag-like protein [Anopheles sinensis]|uniref:Gag-like protein n=1 Tax=Anopheles sinensis TaxID=74873 RepID=A0A084VJA4_ANOSI|nr:gag-like protein [Anopheles sinensis]
MRSRSLSTTGHRSFFDWTADTLRGVLVPKLPLVPQSPEQGTRREHHHAGLPKRQPEVITVTPPKDTSFLVVFRNVRSVPEVAECVRTGSRIQRNTAELVLKGNADAKAVFERVKALAPEGSKTTLRLDTVRLLIRGIDMLAEKGDVANAVGGKVGEVIAEEDVTLQRYFRGDQRAFVEVHRRIANALLGEKLLIGHSRCRVELAPQDWTVLRDSYTTSDHWPLEYSLNRPAVQQQQQQQQGQTRSSRQPPAGRRWDTSLFSAELFSEVLRLLRFDEVAVDPTSLIATLRRACDETMPRLRRKSRACARRVSAPKRPSVEPAI